MINTGYYFDISLELSPEDTEVLHDVSTRIHDRFPDVVMPYADFANPRIRLYEIPIQSLMTEEMDKVSNLFDNFKNQLNLAETMQLRVVRPVRKRDFVYLLLEPVTSSDQTLLNYMHGILGKLYRRPVSTPVIPFLCLKRLFPEASQCDLDELFYPLNRIVTVELKSLSCLLSFDNL